MIVFDKNLLYNNSYSFNPNDNGYDNGFSVIYSYTLKNYYVISTKKDRESSMKFGNFPEIIATVLPINNLTDNINYQNNTNETLNAFITESEEVISSNSEHYIYSTLPFFTATEPNISSSIYSIVTTDPTKSQTEIYSSTDSLVLTTYLNSVNTITTYINILTTEINEEPIESTIIPDQNKNIQEMYIKKNVMIFLF